MSVTPSTASVPLLIRRLAFVPSAYAIEAPAGPQSGTSSRGITLAPSGTTSVDVVPFALRTSAWALGVSWTRSAFPAPSVTAQPPRFPCAVKLAPSAGARRVLAISSVETLFVMSVRPAIAPLPASTETSTKRPSSEPSRVANPLWGGARPCAFPHAAAAPAPTTARSAARPSPIVHLRFEPFIMSITRAQGPTLPCAPQREASVDRLRRTREVCGANIRHEDDVSARSSKTNRVTRR